MTQIKRDGEAHPFLSPDDELLHFFVLGGIVKLRLTALPDAQHALFTTGSSPVSWASVS